MSRVPTTPLNAIVNVGEDSTSPGGAYQFSPNVITAPNGTVITFKFSGTPGNHSVTQSTFANPCQGMDDGFDSGFIMGNGLEPPTWNYTVKNDQIPLWFFCRQKAPSPHCRSGMVGVINVQNAVNSFQTFQAKAEGNTAIPTSSSSSSQSSQPSSSTSRPSPPLGLILGVTLGGLAFLSALLIFILCIRRNQRKKRMAEEAEINEMHRARPSPFILPAAAFNAKGHPGERVIVSEKQQ
ncbi:hypothetical protein C8F01DRAFT_1029582, partial [Mycena amicta]